MLAERDRDGCPHARARRGDVPYPPHRGHSPAPERAVGPLTSVRAPPRRAQRREEPSDKVGQPGRPGLDLTYSGAGVNSVRLPGVMLTRDGEQSPGPWPSIQRGDYVAAKGGAGAVDPGDEEPPPPAQAAPAGDADHPASPPPAGDAPGRDAEQPDPRRIASQPDFGRELTLARQRAGLTVREVARAVGIPASTAGDYFAGRHLPPPSQPGLLTRILRVVWRDGPGRAERVGERSQPDPPRARTTAGRRHGALPGPGQFPA